MSVQEYWTGKGVDYKTLWAGYENGHGYLDKYRSMEAEAQVEYGLTPAENECLTGRLEVLSNVMGGRRLAHAIGVSRRHLSNLLRGKGVVPTSAGTLPK